jgi:hypothetical protein
MFWYFIPWNGTSYTTNQTGTRIAKDGCRRSSIETDRYPQQIIYYAKQFVLVLSWNGTSYTTNQTAGQDFQELDCTADQVLNPGPLLLKPNQSIYPVTPVLVKLYLGS